MQKWEYCAVALYMAGMFGLGKGIFLIALDGERTRISKSYDLGIAIVYLNRLGNIGYEIVGFNFTSTPPVYVWTLKRPIE